MQQMTDEISKIKESSDKNEEILTKIEKADKDSISKKGFKLILRDRHQVDFFVNTRRCFHVQNPI